MGEGVPIIESVPWSHGNGVLFGERETKTTEEEFKNIFQEIQKLSTKCRIEMKIPYQKLMLLRKIAHPKAELKRTGEQTHCFGSCSHWGEKIKIVQHISHV